MGGEKPLEEHDWVSFFFFGHEGCFETSQSLAIEIFFIWLIFLLKTQEILVGAWGN